MRKRVLLAVGGTLASVIMGASAVNGSVAEAGGNHGCDPETGTFYSDDFFAAGDDVVGGLTVDTGSFPSTLDQLFAQNGSADGDGLTSLECDGTMGSWSLFESRLGPGDDTVRLDAKGLGPGYAPLPASIDTVLSGGDGADVISGHPGRDDVTAGPGKDIVDVDDGRRDLVNCGSGVDRADVDRKDDVSGCERRF